MEQTGNQEHSPLPERKLRNGREVYLQLLGLSELPKTPDQLPESIFLPAEALGNLEQSIFATDKDGKERAQIINWNAKKGVFVPSRVALGRETSKGKFVRLPHKGLLRIFLPIPDSNTVISYHTHPHHFQGDFEDFLPSYLDLASWARFQDYHGPIALVASRWGISAIAQTGQKEITSRNFYDILREVKKLYPDIFSQAWHRNFLGFNRLLNDMGLGFYYWKPREDIAPFDALRPGELQKGITFRKPK